jgi:hypothetical protein
LGIQKNRTFYADVKYAMPLKLVIAKKASYLIRVLRKGIFQTFVAVSSFRSILFTL